MQSTSSSYSTYETSSSHSYRASSGDTPTVIQNDTINDTPPEIPEEFKFTRIPKNNHNQPFTILERGPIKVKLINCPYTSKKELKDVNLKPVIHLFPSNGKLGAGAFGVTRPVLCSTHPEQVMVVKKVRPFSAQNTSVSTMIKKTTTEYDLHRKAGGHKGVINCELMGIAPGKNGVYKGYLIQEGAFGGELSEISKQCSNLQVTDKIAVMKVIFKRLASALHHIHNTGVIHRDLSPKNIVFTCGGQPKITDFGSAYCDSINPNAKSKFVGTHGHIAPEIYQKMGCSIKSDIFSFGVLMTYFFINEDILIFPSQRTPVFRTIEEIQSTQFEAIEKLKNSQSPPALNHLIFRLLAKNPKNRPTMAQVMSDDFFKDPPTEFEFKTIWTQIQPQQI